MFDIFPAGTGHECRKLEEVVFTVGTSSGCTENHMLYACHAEVPSSNGPQCQLTCYCSATSQCKVALLLGPDQSVDYICDILPVNV